MKRQRISIRPGVASDYSFDDLYEEISNNWQGKALRLQARRWRALKHTAKPTSH